MAKPFTPTQTTQERRAHNIEMLLKIYKNGEQVNEINSTDPANIYKHIAQIYHAKDTKRASKTKIEISYNSEIKATQTFKQDKTQIPGTTYTYKYMFVGIRL